jgi:Zn-dependent protease with chaperone function
MATTTPPGKLTGISPKAYEHPADRAATAALKSIPMLDLVTRRLIEFGYERALRQAYLGGSIKLGPRQLPDVWASYLEVLDVLDMPDVYDLYVTNTPITNAMALGAGKPIIVVDSGLLNLLDTAELQTVLAHEVGHILSDHVLYRTALAVLVGLSGVGRMGLLAGLPLLGIRHALLEWARATELSSDRAATLVNRDPLVTCRLLMALAAGVSSSKLDLDAFLEQAQHFHESEDGLDKIQRFWLQARAGHPLAVRRCREVMDWVRTGDYERIVAGDYVRRGQEAPAREEAGGAVDFYAERFAGLIRDTGDAVQTVGQQFGDWLRGSRGNGDDADDSHRED